MTTEFTVADFTPEGNPESVESFDTSILNEEHVAFFAKHLQHLSDDLELPLEGKLPVQSDFIEYRIGSESKNAAFVLYYHHDENVHISLFLRGENEEDEYELMQIIRCLLLNPNYEEDLGEEEIDSILDDARFDFEQVETRPALFTVTFWTAEEKDVIQHIREMDRHLALAYFNR
jgi:hypothetical protein